MAAPWLRFKIGDSACAIPLHAVAEVTSAEAGTVAVMVSRTVMS